MSIFIFFVLMFIFVLFGVSLCKMAAKEQPTPSQKKQQKPVLHKDTHLDEIPSCFSRVYEGTIRINDVVKTKNSTASTQWARGYVGQPIVRGVYDDGLRKWEVYRKSQIL